MVRPIVATLFALFAGVVLLLGGARASGPRVALVIGNANYGPEIFGWFGDRARPGAAL